MAIRAVHEQWGAVFAHLPDLGCGRDWAEVWKVRPLAPLSCDECRHPMYAKVSSSSLRFFAHAPGAPKCALAEESPAHHLLKLELAAAARDAGAYAELEVRGPDGAWRADVLASDPAGTWTIALEAQLSPITPDDITARTERMLEDGVSSVWFSDRVRVPWFGAVPWAGLETVDGVLAIKDGLAKFSGKQWEAGPRGVPVAEFLRWVFARRVVPHRRATPVRSPLSATWHVLWTAPQYATAETDYLEVKRRRKREQEEQERASRARRHQEQQLEMQKVQERARAEGGHQAAVQALLARQAALGIPAAKFVHRATGRYPFVADKGEPQYAMGVPVYLGLTPYGVVCPVAGRVAAVRDRLAPLVVFVASEGERQRIAAQARPGQRIEVLKGTDQPS
ncbi:RNA methyltransferase [Streptomyces sp. PCS3-D2]|uniref:competence protein CoiA family protein n=1 Tax=Streptomyces sp. PCS3-D2 TaxID=1460244 RepID=UPI0004480D20|nr:competence protein CoiA family protein [Streptomyces sp. PCS3-D2]WKV74137.1 RNA methyltransferase [Streptomyces sp. PCS3-D2]